MVWRFQALFLLLSLISATTRANDSAIAAPNIGSEFSARDTLAIGDEPTADAKDCLKNLAWNPAEFTVRLAATEPGCGDFLVRFSSARPIADVTNDLVALEWFAARDDAGNITRAPAIVLIHESGRRMTVGRLLARGLSGQGMHAFLLHLPGYGARRTAAPPPLERVLPAMRQGISDARRARDAVAALPLVDHSTIGLQGTSLGGFVAAAAAGLDHGYDRVFIFLAGGNLHKVVLHGARDAEKLHAKLTAAGVTDEQIKDFAREVEPLRLAHRIDPSTCWLYTGKYDNVVPRECSLALAKAARLPADHHVELPTDHYTGFLYLPQIVEQIRQHMTQESR